MSRRQKRALTRRQNTHSWPIAYRWLATGTLVAYTAIGSHVVAAQNESSPAGINRDSATVAVRRFNIPPGPLGQVLDAFQAATGIRSSLERAAIGDVQSPGVTGLYIPEQALNLEQVEVIKGASSAYTGRGSTGGVINLVSKMPTVALVIGGSLAFGTDGIRRATRDLNTPVRFLGERTAFRLNAVAHDSGVAGRDVVSSERWGFAPSLGFGLGTPTALQLTGVYHNLLRRWAEL